MQTRQNNPLIVGLVIALVCSVLVSASVVLLSPIQEISRTAERVKIIADASGIKGDPVEVFGDFEAVIVDLSTGEYRKAESVDEWSKNFERMIKDPNSTRTLTKVEDVASIRRSPNEMLVYVAYKDDKPYRAIMHMYGMGLYSVLHAYLAVDVESMTVAGFKFFEHGETPGLGAEIENPKWQSSWVGKNLYDAQGKVRYTFSRQPVIPSMLDYAHTVDAISGATLTTNGVEGMLYFWLGDLGYRKFLDRINEEAK